MSDVSGGPGWWQASDLKWYPPERHPQHAASLPPPPPPEPSAHAGSPPPSARGGQLGDIERNRILDQAVSSRNRPVISGSLNGVLGIHEPKITINRSTFSAEMLWGRTFASPGIVVLLALLSFVTCGFFLPVWLYLTLRPNRYAQTVFIDEYGLQHWGTAPISLGQRVVSLLVLIGIIWWIIWMVNTWNSLQTHY
jgi:hypothetical protein